MDNVCADDLKAVKHEEEALKENCAQLENQAQSLFSLMCLAVKAICIVE